MKTAVSIAGSDCSGGAGIQADIKTMTMNGVYAMSVITALTAQNTQGVSAVYEVSPEFLGQQLDAVFTDIYPDAVKVGMLSSAQLVELVADYLERYEARSVVVDPVMLATSGSVLTSEDALEAMKAKLFARACLITPNIMESEVLAEMPIHSSEDMHEAARRMFERYGCAVLCKGGHKLEDAHDVLYSAEGPRWFYGRRIDNPNTHGTGCTLSSAIAANLAKGYSLVSSIERSKRYISQALAAHLDLGSGSGPLNHACCLSGEFADVSAPETSLR